MFFDQTNRSNPHRVVENGTLFIEQNVLEGAGGLCCPKKFVRRYFTWDGKGFRNVKSETLAVEEKKSGS
jgi:hypothetical protein